MKKLIHFIVVITVAVLLSGMFSCKKEAPWEWCNDCSVENITGQYSGTGNIIKYTDSVHYTETKGKTVYLAIEASGSNIQLSTGVVNLFSVIVTGNYDNTYYIEIPGYRTRVSAKIWKRENDLKIIGTAKKFDSDNKLTELFDFEVIRSAAE